METTVKKSLFATAKKAPAVSAAKKEKETVHVPDISDKLGRCIDLRESMKEMKAELEMIEGEIKPIFRDVYMNLYIEQKRKPESFKVKTDDGSQSMLVIVMDKYIKLDEGKTKLLEQYPDVTETKKTYTFDPIILDRCAEQISEAIMSADISDADKENLLVCTEVTSVKAGTIERLMQYSDPAGLFQLIEPILMLK